MEDFRAITGEIGQDKKKAPGGVGKKENT